jgi:hypothetical protein
MTQKKKLIEGALPLEAINRARERAKSSRRGQPFQREPDFGLTGMTYDPASSTLRAPALN